MYATAPHSKKAMHTCAVNTAVDHAKDLYEQELGARFREVASKTPEFTSEFASRLVIGKGKDQQKGITTNARCESCLRLVTVTKAPKSAGKRFSGGFGPQNSQLVVCECGYRFTTHYY
jgi:hypothetical protein